jgi:hypothetical protein
MGGLQLAADLGRLQRSTREDRPAIWDQGKGSENFSSQGQMGRSAKESAGSRSPEPMPYDVDRQRIGKLISSNLEYLREFPKDKNTWVETGRYYLQLDRREDAAKCFRWAQSLDRSDKEVEKLYLAAKN